MSHQPPLLVIYGVTHGGQRFRPSDWAERLAGILAPYGPAGATRSHLAYSPYAVPRSLQGIPCVVIDARLRDIEPLAWKFVHDFAADNDLKTAEGDHAGLMGVSSGLPAK